MNQSSLHAASPASSSFSVSKEPGVSRLRAVLIRASALGGALMAAAALAGGCGGGLGDEDYAAPERPVVNAVDLNNRPYCVGTCEPDYGPTVIPNCAFEEQGLEFFPVDVLNADDPAIGVLQFYSYTDETSNFIVSGPEGFNALAPAENYEPPGVAVPQRCQGEGSDYVHHIRGGLFREWGGGMGRRLLNMPTDAGCPVLPAREGDPDFCPDPDPRIEDIADEPGNETLRANFYGMMVDLRGWEGISFWARSGPNNTGGIRVYVGDRQLDEDIAFLEQRAGLEPMCRRARECGCRNHKPCTRTDITEPTLDPEGQWRCYDPATDGPSLLAVRQEYLTSLRNEVAFDFDFEPCGPTLCNEDNPSFQLNQALGSAPDPSFAESFGNQCLSYKLTNDLEDFFCYNPDDPASFPPDGPQRCGDGWAKGVQLTNEWQFYKVPFTELRQEGYAQMFQYLDLSKITLVRFTWMQGWVDVWLDDVRFYRRASDTAAK